MIEILMYLFENYMNESTRIKQTAEQLTHELQQAGFPIPAIQGAFDWLSDLSQLDQHVDFNTNSSDLIRSFSVEEQQYFDMEC